MAISDAALTKLRQSMKGHVHTQADAKYAEASKIWNGDIHRNPAVVASCTNVEDVQAAIAFGRANGLTIAVKGGGHSMSGQSTADGALMIDLRPMNKVTIDVAARRAKVQSGAIW